MRGREVALATLLREEVREPTINFCWMTSTSYMSRVAGANYWDDPEAAWLQYVRRKGVNLVPQWYMPGEGHRRLEEGLTMHDVPDAYPTPEQIVQQIDALPTDEEVERDFDIDGAARAYAETNETGMAKMEHEALVISGFGQADFMGGYTRWGYENYLLTVALDPEGMRRYYHHSAARGRLTNQAIALACEKHGIAPFVYSGQDICAGGGPIVAPETLRDIYFPELRWCLEPLVDAGVGIIWHCDGDIRPIADDLLALGVDGLQGFEEEHGVDYTELAKRENRRGKPIALWGCVSVTSTFPHGSVDDVKAAVRRSFEVAGPRRGFVLSSTSSVMPEVPHGNIDAFFDYGREFGREFLG